MAGLIALGDTLTTKLATSFCGCRSCFRFLKDDKLKHCQYHKLQKKLLQYDPLPLNVSHYGKCTHMQGVYKISIQDYKITYILYAGPALHG